MPIDPSQSTVPPTERSGGAAPDAEEAQQKGDWAATAAEGIVPPEDGGADAPPEMLGEDPELGSSVLGATTGSDEPATETGVDLSAGDNADATRDGGPNLPDQEGVEPDVKDGAAIPFKQADIEAAR